MERETKMPNNNIEKQYNELKKKYTLPEFRDINFELELDDFEETGFLLRAIIRRIAEKLDFYSTMIEEVLQPDTSNLYAMHETRFFDDDEKKQMYNFYMILMSLSRQTIELSLELDERNDAEFISRFFDEWKELKSKLIEYTKKMRSAWKTEADVKEDLGYLG